LLVIFFGFIVRAQLMRYELFFEFDSYWHARMVSYILQGLPAPAVDPLAYYQNIAAATIGSAPYFFWYVSAAIYKLFTLNAGYDLETWVLFVKILPALYGALIVGAMYFLGKELFKGTHEKQAGLLVGIFAAIMPAFVYRTMGGFFEDDSFGFLWMVLGFIFFVRATRNGSFSFENKWNAVLAGISFALMALSWSAFNMLVPILLGVGVVEFLLWMREGECDRAKHFGYAWLVSFALLALGATIQTKLFWLDQFGGVFGNLLLGSSELIRAPHVAAFILIVLFAVSVFWKATKSGKLSPQIIRMVTNGVILIMILAPLLVFLFNISLRTGDVLGQTVGEESEGRGYFGNKYSFMVLFAIIGLPACGYFLLKRARQFAFLTLPVVWLVVTFFMAWGKLKFTYYWGLPLALMSGIVCVFLLKWMAHHSNRTQKIAAVLVGVSIIAGIAAGTIFVTQNIPNIELSPGWKTALFWASNNLPADAKFMNWWDEGHWVSFLSNRKVLIDNRNADSAASSDVAKFILAKDENDASAIIEKYGSTHLIFGDDLLSKQSSLGFYAYGTPGLSDPRLQGMFGVVHPCSRRVEPVTREEKYVCGQNSLTIQEYESLPTQWQSAPNNNQQGTPFNVYRDTEKTHLYAFSSPTNQAFLIRMWMGDPAITHYTELYRNTGGVRIYSYIPGEI
ncbi:MAG: hypothetical protein FJY86_00315, partial [Candidatus Diapherotrites archaeon]|nr:hypothetical protein [Candidatus Diapherotrites archaeon]